MTIELLVFAVLAQAQDARPAYEVASIKPNPLGPGHSRGDETPGRIVLTNVTLKHLIERAYGVKAFQVTGPDFMEKLCFDITAKYPQGTKDNERALMLRTLLEDRFKLAVHLESKEMPGYALMVAKRGFKLKPVEAGGRDTSIEGAPVVTLTAKKNSMQDLADVVARELGEIVVDKTGIKGVYDFELRWSKSDDSADTAPALFTAIQDTLGLRLQAEKVPVQIVVVDHVERAPSEN